MSAEPTPIPNPPTSTANFTEEEKELERFIKFLVLKSIQVVVQSRLGEKIQTPCKTRASVSDWFNIVIDDHPDVYEETRAAVNLPSGQSIVTRSPICVEISLKTVEGDQMILEVWSLDLRTPVEGKVELLIADHAIYSRMNILIKSVFSLTRAIPAYKLSRRQCPDSYGIYYRVYVGKPQLHTLGEGHKNFRIGQVYTMFGNISISLAYRTKMTISPTTQRCDTAMMLKSDHFLKDQSPKHIRYNHIKKAGEKKVIDIDKPLRPGAFVDESKIKQYTEDDFILPEEPPFGWLVKKNRAESGGSSNEDGTQSPLGTSNNNNNVSFKSYEQQQSPIKSLLVSVGVEERKSRKPSRTALPPDDENLLKELNFPFASPSSRVNDLAKFYRDCYHAPPLHSCELNAATQSQGVTIDPVDDLSKQLELFETSLEDYEILVSQLGCSTTSSKSSSTKSN